MGVLGVSRDPSPTSTSWRMMGVSHTGHIPSEIHRRQGETPPALPAGLMEISIRGGLQCTDRESLNLHDFCINFLPGAADTGL